mmetsp:Transcript_17127/g.28163  ORF Transcript_17127/g.28163 Transcript_17127/m.28163 type:complete len:206 (-) Transcript_17127:3192-3809(-)
MLSLDPERVEPNKEQNPRVEWNEDRVVLSATAALTKAPGIGLLIAVVEGLDLLLLLALGQLCGVGLLEEGGGQLGQPLGLDGTHLPHVLLGRQHKLVIEHPFGVLVEEGGGGMDVDGLALHQSAVPLLRVLLGCMRKEATADGLADLVEVLPRRYNVQLIPVHNGQQLLADVLGTSHGAGLNKVLVAPRVAELVGLPRLVHRQQR